MTNRINDIVREAVARGLVDTAVVEAEKRGHPWPVVVLTGFGALLASLPICGLLALAFVKSRNGTELYVLGCLVLGSAAALLHIRRQPLFLEYLSICLLGSGLFMLWIPARGASSDAICAIAAIVVTIAVPQAWIRVLFSAVAVFMLNMALMSLDARSLVEEILVWNGWYLATFAWLAGHIVLHHAERHARYPLAALAESALIGGGAVIIVMLGYFSGQSFLISQLVPGQGWLSPGSSGDWFGYAPALLSAATALAAGVWLIQLGRFDRRLLCAALPALVLTSCFADSLGALLLIAVACIAWHRPRLAMLTGLASLWTIGGLYYSLDWPLLYKAALLLLAAAILLAADLRPGRLAAEAAQLKTDVPVIEKRWRKAAFVVPAVLTLVLINVGIVRNEQVIRQGQTVFVELAPVDPRSLMQGDFMALNFALPAELDEGTAAVRLAVARSGENGIATVLRFHDGAVALQKDEFLIEIKRQGTRNVLATDAWHFEEGDAKRWSRARYGEFRVDRHGKAILVGLRGAALEKL